MNVPRPCPTCGRALLVVDNVSRGRYHAEAFCNVVAHYVAAGFSMEDMRREVGAFSQRVRDLTGAEEAELLAEHAALQRRIGALEAEVAALRQKVEEVHKLLLGMVTETTKSG